MLKLRLSKHRLLIDPPQNLLVVWITDETSGAQITVFHEIAEIDLSDVPRRYKAITNPIVDRFDIRAGQTYSIALAGNVMMQTSVVAE